MTWHSLNFEKCRYPLLCSDRPCVFTKGIQDRDCIVALPLSPKRAFIASNTYLGLDAGSNGSADNVGVGYNALRSNTL